MPTLTELFEQLDWNMVEEFVKQRQEEHLHLDFKTVNNLEMSSKDDKRNFAKAVSGFGNSDGGIIVWGIDARKNPDGVDCATAIVELNNPPLMMSRLNALTGDATTPIVDGVRHKAIINPASGCGVVATLVPENDGGPFMAKLTENRYYKRSGDGFYFMEHFDLADMFGRRQKPRLAFLMEPVRVENGGEEYSISVENHGRAVARHAGFLIWMQDIELKNVNGNHLTNLSKVNRGNPVVGWSYDTGVIHPNGVRTNVGSITIARKASDANFVVEGRLYCESAQFVRIALVFGVPQSDPPANEES